MTSIVLTVTPRRICSRLADSWFLFFWLFFCGSMAALNNLLPYRLITRGLRQQNTSQAVGERSSRGASNLTALEVLCGAEQSLSEHNL
jgi:hypothetical protein